MKPKRACISLSERDDLIRVLKDTISALQDTDASRVKEISNHITHCASIFQTAETIKTAVIIYSLSKILERGHGIEKVLVDLLEQGKEAVEEGRMEDYRKRLDELFKKASEVDQQLNLYAEQVINDAQVKKGSKIYQHGVSLRQTASMLGISLWDLMNYVGKTKLQERIAETLTVKKRLGHARTLFQQKE